MTEAVWLASYPKSGNTWLRFLIAHLAGADLSRSAELATLVPDGHTIADWSSLERSRPRVIKTHWLPRHLPAPMTTRAVIYIARNPFDVIASNLRYALLAADETVLARPEAELLRIRMAYVELFLRHGGDPNWMEFGFGSWREHLEAWSSFAATRPALFLRYEDLHDDPRAVLRRIGRFLELRPDEARIERALAASSFDAMRRLEERELAARQAGLFADHVGDGTARGGRFIAKGQACFGLGDFEPGQWLRIRDVFAAEIDRLGYRRQVDALMPEMARSA